MPLPGYRAQELIQNTGVVSAGNTGAGLRQFALGLSDFGARIGVEEERAAVARARVEGGNAVTRDSQGKISIEPLDFSSPVSRYFLTTSGAFQR